MWTSPLRRCRRVTSFTGFTLVAPPARRLRICWLRRRVGSSGAWAPRYTPETGMRVPANRRQIRSAQVVFPEPSGPTRMTRWPDGRSQLPTRSAAAPARARSQRTNVPGRRRTHARTSRPRSGSARSGWPAWRHSTRRPASLRPTAAGRAARQVVGDGRARLAAHGDEEAEVGREALDDPVRECQVVRVDDQVDVLPEVLRPALVVAEDRVADALVVVGGEQRLQEAARE